MVRSKIFISYSHEDARDLEQLQRFLLPLEQRGLIDAWDDTRLEAGDDWAADIDRVLAEAAVAVLLVTQDFVASKFITGEELPRILEAEARGELTVIPVFLRPSIVDKIDYAFGAGSAARQVNLTRFQGFGTPQRVLMKLDKSDREEIYAQLACRLLEITEGALAGPPEEPVAAPSEPVEGEPPSRPARAADPSLVEMCFRVAERNGSAHVTLSSDGYDPVTSELEIDLGPKSRISEVIAQIEGSPQRDDLMDVGSQLWAGLLSGGVESRFEEISDARCGDEPFFHVRLELPSPRLALLPWETFYDESLRAFLGCHPQYCVIRDPGEIRPPALPERRPGALAVLAIVPEGPGLKPEREWRGLRHAVDRLGTAIRLERLEGPATPDGLAEKLGEEHWDVVHYVGLGETRDDEPHILINDDDGGERWIDVDTCGALFLDARARLAVLSCVQGRTPSPSRSLAAFGPVLLAAGVPAVVASRYELPDDVAGHFARSFYSELVKSGERGRIDRAVAAARRSVFLNHNATNVRGFASPVLYLAPGNHRLPALAGAEEDAGAAPAPAASESTLSAAASARMATDPRLARLLDLVRKQRCVPIVGPGLLHADGAPSRRRLVDALARECDYPRAQELQLFEIGGDWLVDQVLQRVCQHFQHVKDLYDLVDVVLATLGRSTPPPALLQLARWPAPGIVCATMDGLMADALERQNRQSRMVNYIDREADSDESLPLLVHLRGTLAEQDSLILTEEDHDQLWQRLQNLNNQIVRLVAGFGRAVLLLGVSPQDTLIRRFLHQLRPQGLSKKQGSLFFVCRGRSPVDEAYWARYETQWLDEDPTEVIAMITDLLGSEPAP
ncbi:MAG: CHAT domain-containing protein [bacterium]|nr:CHAT domain-containing protein [bacterium]